MPSFKALWQFCFFWIFYPIFTILIISPSLIVGFVIRQYGWVALTQRLWGSFIFWGAGQRLCIEGASYLDAKKPYLIIANHSSWGDIPALAALVKTPVSWVIKESLLNIPILKYAFQLGLGIPIPRANARTSQKLILKRIRILKEKAKTSVIIFPEGTRSQDGSVQEFKRGFVRIMKEYKLDILPVTLSGFHRYLPSGSFVPNPKAKLHVYIHPPIPVESLEHKDEFHICEELRVLIESSLIR